MSTPVRVTAIVGSYRKEGVIHQIVDAMLASAQAAGAEVRKIDLLDNHVAFCTNCRSCTQQEGEHRGKCSLEDDMNAILDTLEQSDAFILASPMNFWTVTALMKRFMERLVCFSYWPWGGPAPKYRKKVKTKKAVLVMASAAPSIMARLMTRMVGLMKSVARVLGAKTVGIMFIGLCAQEHHYQINDRIKAKAQRLGQKLATPHS